ncbi:hypothetical protein IU451_19970 [Nocardia cyriacigeorgica]|uniref:hypothetical protein n=1 Tax=Nocardia cyriacigeorgica TaxID=135487 RepID=UPI0018955B00|nr:hypothetical protein [Nocardia cyriacigeorgica]MBF6324792.1 hypothetical protein [Nocardia cyriacigeorgica]
MDLTCPSCNQLDLVQSVPAIQAGGTSTTFGTAVYSGTGFTPMGMVPAIGTATVESTHTSALAQDLARAPQTRSSMVLSLAGLVMVAPALIAVVGFVASAGGGARDFSASTAVIGSVFLLMLGTPGWICLWIAASRSRRNRQILRGRRRAYPVWQAGIYCHRCGLVFWPFSPAPGIPVRQPITPANFRWYVWSAGGYLNG